MKNGNSIPIFHGKRKHYTLIFRQLIKYHLFNHKNKQMKTKLF